MTLVRVDELLLQAHEQLLRRYPPCRVDIDLGDEAPPAVRGNEALLLHHHPQRARQCLQILGRGYPAGAG